jgi:uncharacterized protein YdiU (UPF0061 family)
MYVRTTPLEQAEIFLAEIDRIISLPGVQSATQRIEYFKAFAEAFRNTVKYQQGYRLEHEQLIALVSKLLECLTSQSPDMKRAIREVPGLRDARRELIEYIERAKMSIVQSGVAS